ncbi:MAG TPA: thioredoxin family protein [Anaerolineae bacterium]
MSEETQEVTGEEIFGAETWAELPDFFEKLPEPVHLIVWGDEAASRGEREAARLCQALAGRFDSIDFEVLPRRANYPYYPVIGIMGGRQGEWQDFGLRIIGLPSGYQATSLVAAVQAVSFRGMTLEAITRIELSKLAVDVDIEVMTTAENEGGPIMAQTVFGLAAASAHVRAFLIMADVFPEAVTRYSINVVPHTVINGRVHIEGVVDEETLLQHMARAIKG